MPRPRRDGTPARSVPNRRRLTEAFVKTVRPDPNRVVVIWDTFQRGLALAVQPSGHRAYKCVYTIRGRGARWYHLSDAKAISLADACKLSAKVMYQVADGKDPHVDRLVLSGGGALEQATKRHIKDHVRNSKATFPKTGKPVVYFVLVGNAIKIGFTTDMQQRLKNFRYATTERIKFLVASAGDRELEARLHALFAASKIRNDFFKPDRLLLDFIHFATCESMDVALQRCFPDVAYRPSIQPTMKEVADQQRAIRDLARRELLQSENRASEALSINGQVLNPQRGKDTQEHVET